MELEGVDDLSADVFRAFINTLRLHRQLMRRTLGGHGTHPGQGICLHLIAAHGHSTQRDLADALHLSRPTVSKMLQAMERSGLVERRPDESDQRLTRVELTAAGRSLEEELRVVTARLVNETIGALPEDDRRELARLLGELAAVMRQAIGARAGASPARAHDRQEVRRPVIALLRERLTPYWRQIVLVLVLLLVQAITNLYLPTLNADLINNGVVKGDTHYIMVTGVVMLVVTLLLGIATIIAVYWGAKTAMAFGRDVRGALFRKVESFSLAELNHFGTPSLITRTTNDVQQVQMVVLLMLNVVVSAPIMCVGGIIMALRLNVPLSSVIVVAIPIMAVFIALVVRKALPLFRAMQVKIDRVNQVTRETLSGMRVIRAFDRMDYEERRFAEANDDLTRDGAQGHAPLRRDAPDPHGDPAALDRGHHVVRQHPGRRARHADRRPHGLPHLHHPDPSVGAHGDDHVRHGPARGRLGRAHPGGPRDGTVGDRPADSGDRRPRAGARRVRRRGVPLPGRRGAGAQRHLLLVGPR